MAKRYGGQAPAQPASAGDVPMWSKRCAVDGCSEDTVIALISVRDQTGRTRVGVASRFLMHNRDKWTLLEGYTFDGWITRCGPCFARENDLRPITDRVKRDDERPSDEEWHRE